MHRPGFLSSSRLFTSVFFGGALVVASVGSQPVSAASHAGHATLHGYTRTIKASGTTHLSSGGGSATPSSSTGSQSSEFPGSAGADGDLSDRSHTSGGGNTA